jgi:hypothetical protein
MGDTVRCGLIPTPESIGVTMDKLMFFFTRKAGLTHAEFAEHYLQEHAPLGMRLTVTMAGYTVNLVDGDDTVDAVTEIWTASAADFFDPAKSFASEDDAKAMMADHDSFIGPYDAYAVEERAVHGDVPLGAAGARTSGAKLIVRYGDGDTVPAVPDGVRAVVDHRIVQSLTPDAPALAVVRSIWLDPGVAVSVDGALTVDEHRQMVPVA